MGLTSQPAAAARGQKRKRNDDTTSETKTHAGRPVRTDEGHGIQQHPPKPTTSVHGRNPRPAARSTNGDRNQHRQNSFISSKPTSNLARRAALERSRVNLPIHAHSDSILSALDRTDILLLSGETGSGKSTQIPQFLLSAPWRKKRIAVTQPRRVAAINLARRVADELGTPVGRHGEGAKVGYSVRFDENVGRSNEVKFLTEGMLLMELLRDPGLSEYDVVVVDEVHERSVNVDLILGFLRDLVLQKGRGAEKRGRGIKVVVMSATADIERLEEFFEEGYRLRDEEEVGAQNGNEHAKYSLNEANEVVHSDTALSKKGAKNPKKTNSITKKLAPEKPTANGQQSSHVSQCHVEGRQYPVQTIYLPEPASDFSDAALKCIFQVHCKEPMPGDILVFLTGQETIQALQRNVEEYAQSLTSDYPKLLVLPIYAALPQTAQQHVFDPAPSNTRKVILATNIAETSITVPGVRFVIDCGKEKRKQFRPRLGLDSLLVKPVSKSSAVQRKGRAGREAPGKCWRLYTESDYTSFDAENLPEILRCDLADAILKMKANGVNDVLSFPLLTRPSREALARSLMHLHSLSALTDIGAISSIGQQIARLPLSPSYGRVLLAASQNDPPVLLPVIDIIAALSSDNSIFLNIDTEERREEAHAARSGLIRRQGDHLTMLAAVQAYSAENSDRKRWCERHLIGHRAMQGVMDVRKQLRGMVGRMGLFDNTQTSASTSQPTSKKDTKDKAEATIANYDRLTAPIDDATAESILKCFLTGFRQNVARLMPDGSYRTFLGNQTLAIHPSSVLFGRKVEAIVYAEFVYTNRTYARGVSAVQAAWVGEVISEVEA